MPVFSGFAFIRVNLCSSVAKTLRSFFALEVGHRTFRCRKTCVTERLVHPEILHSVMIAPFCSKS